MRSEVRLHVTITASFLIKYPYHAFACKLGLRRNPLRRRAQAQILNPAHPREAEFHQARQNLKVKPVIVSTFEPCIVAC